MSAASAVTEAVARAGARGRARQDDRLAMSLARGDVEAIAAALAPRVAALLREPFPTRGLVKAERVAALLDVDVSWVYEHKAVLGAVRLGDGRGALRFEAPRVLAYLRDRRVDAGAQAPRLRPGPQRRRSRDGVELLPLPDGLR